MKYALSKLFPQLLMFDVRTQVGFWNVLN